MAWIKLTRMLERKLKYRDRGDLRAIAYKQVGPVWVHSEHLAAVWTFDGPIVEETDAVDAEDGDMLYDGPITELSVVGSPDAIYVSEPADTVLAAVRGR